MGLYAVLSADAIFTGSIRRQRRSRRRSRSRRGTGKVLINPYAENHRTRKGRMIPIGTVAAGTGPRYKGCVFFLNKP